MKKKCMSLLLALTTVCAMTAVSFARELPYQWAVSFNGSKMTSNFDNDKMKDALYGLQPGDTATFTVTLRNDSSEVTDWYMSNKIISSLEDSKDSAVGGAYSYELTYSDGKTTQVLYSSETVGGEKNSKTGEGLNEATNSLDEMFALDELSKKETGTVTLTVGLDGETQGNGYQDTLAELKLDFGVEVVTTTPNVVYQDTTTTQTTPGTNRTVYTSDATANPATTVNSTTYTSPKTGDTTDMVQYIIGLAVSGLLILVIAIISIRRDKKKK